jgi:hypothetical protein
VRRLAERARDGAGLVGALAVGAVCVACCFPPALALAGAGLALGVAAAAWLLASPVVLAAGIAACLAILGFAIRRWPQKQRAARLVEPGARGRPSGPSVHG